jgi:hypothetical protein
MELDRQTYSRADMPKKTPAPTQVAQNTPAPAAAQATEQPMAPQTTGTRARRLPKTASPFPMVGLAGLFALGTSVALRAIAKRSS